ncbi:MAG: methanol dehydrogenase, partial [Alphaproteobacteria bacterium]
MALSLCTLLWLAAVPAVALVFPALNGRVVDEANILDPPTRAALTQKIADFEAKTSDQLVVVTLKSLQGTSIEDFGVELGRRWQIGQKDTNNGVLL